MAIFIYTTKKVLSNSLEIMAGDIQHDSFRSHINNDSHVCKMS